MRMQRLEKRELTGRIKTLKEFPFLRNMTMFWDKGNGYREEREIDNMNEAKIRLDQLEREISLAKNNENELWEQSIAYEFFQKIAYLKRKEGILSL